MKLDEMRLFPDGQIASLIANIFKALVGWTTRQREGGQSATKNLILKHTRNETGILLVGVLFPKSMFSGFLVSTSCVGHSCLQKKRTNSQQQS